MLTLIDFVLSYYGYMLEDLNIQTLLKQHLSSTGVLPVYIDKR